MKKLYLPPQIRKVFQMEGYLEAFCISGLEYVGSEGEYDPDSD